MPVHSITIDYVAILREQRGLATETLQTQASTAAALYEELAARHHFTLAFPHLAVAINNTVCPAATPLAAHDHVVFLPPMSGG